jgi:hypothetical protein
MLLSSYNMRVFHRCRECCGAILEPGGRLTSNYLGREDRLAPDARCFKAGQAAFDS